MIDQDSLDEIRELSRKHGIFYPNPNYNGDHSSVDTVFMRPLDDLLGARVASHRWDKTGYVGLFPGIFRGLVKSLDTNRFVALVEDMNSELWVCHPYHIVFQKEEN